jgi:hypothetical protein
LHLNSAHYNSAPLPSSACSKAIEYGTATFVISFAFAHLQLSRKMTKIKEKGIAKGKWPGRAADKSIAKEEQEQEYNEYLDEVIFV